MGGRFKIIWWNVFLHEPLACGLGFVPDARTLSNRLDVKNTRAYKFYPTDLTPPYAARIQIRPEVSDVPDGYEYL